MQEGHAVFETSLSSLHHSGRSLQPTSHIQAAGNFLQCLTCHISACLRVKLVGLPEQRNLLDGIRHLQACQAHCCSCVWNLLFQSVCKLLHPPCCASELLAGRRKGTLRGTGQRGKHFENGIPVSLAKISYYLMLRTSIFKAHKYERNGRDD